MPWQHAQVASSSTGSSPLLLACNLNCNGRRRRCRCWCAPPLLQAGTCALFEVQGYPTMRLGLAADMATASKDKVVEVQPASRHADSVLAWLGKQLDV